MRAATHRVLRMTCGAMALYAALAGGGAQAAPADWPADTFAVLCYHEIRDDAKQRPDSYTLESAKLALQFAWLRGQGYHVINLDEVIAARRDHKPLPPKAVMLSFDDGLESAYSRAFPLLQAFHYPAVVGLVGSWLEEPGHGSTHEAPRYGDTTLSRADFLKAGEIGEMQHSGLIEFASHTFALHEGIVANPQGNLEPAAVARAYDPAGASYEDEAHYAGRVRTDLVQNNDRIAALTGTRPRLVIWPYGEHNHTTDRISAELGMPYGMSLDLGLNTPDVPLARMRRVLITNDFTTADLARVLQEPVRRLPIRAVQVDPGLLVDADPKREESNLSKLLDRIKALGVNAVYLQAFADPGGTGRATALYFPNGHLPMKADIFNRVAWQLHTRAAVDVYAWLPLMSFDLPATDSAEAKGAIADIYADLSASAAFQGLLISGDAPDADLRRFSIDLAQQLQADRDYLLTARRLSAEGAREAHIDALQSFDYVVVIAAPQAQHNGRMTDHWLKDFVGNVATLPRGLEKTIFELPVVAGTALAAEISALRRAGARNIGYFPDDVMRLRPAVEAVRPVLSLRSFPGDN